MPQRNLIQDFDPCPTKCGHYATKTALLATEFALTTALPEMGAGVRFGGEIILLIRDPDVNYDHAYLQTETGVLCDDQF